MVIFIIGVFYFAARIRKSEKAKDCEYSTTIYVNVLILYLSTKPRLHSKICEEFDDKFLTKLAESNMMKHCLQ